MKLDECGQKWLDVVSVYINLYADADTDAVTHSSNTRSYTPWSILPSSRRSFFTSPPHCVLCLNMSCHLWKKLTFETLLHTYLYSLKSLFLSNVPEALWDQVTQTWLLWWHPTHVVQGNCWPFPIGPLAYWPKLPLAPTQQTKFNSRHFNHNACIEVT